MSYALIENGVVVNLIHLHPMNADDFPTVVPVGEYPVTIGDTYTDGVFYRDGEKLKTAAEDMKAEMADMKEALNMLGVFADE